MKITATSAIVDVRKYRLSYSLSVSAEIGADGAAKKA